MTSPYTWPWLAAALALPCAAWTGTTAWRVEPTAGLAEPRAAHQATPLGAAQTLLVSGGCTARGCGEVTRSAELIDTRRGGVLQRLAMAEQRVGHVAAPLPDGGVLVAGGWTGRSVSRGAELFDPRAARFVALPDMASPRMDATATPLGDGAVLLAGGAAATNQPLAQAERFDPQRRAFVPVGEMSQARSHHAAVRLPDGRVLVAGGLVARQTATRSAELFDPATGRFSPTGAMQRARCKLAAVLLRDGRVMVIAGSEDCDERRRIADTEIFDPRTGRFEPGPALQSPRYKIVQAAAVLDNGDVVVAGDARDVEVWTPGSPAFVKAEGGVGAALAFSTATALPGGRLLVLGGYDDDIRPTAGAWLLTRP